MYYTRKAKTVFDEDTAMTLLKPYSGEYKNQLFVIYEDAYGEVTGILTPVEDIKLRLDLTDAEFEEILNEL